MTSDIAKLMTDDAARRALLGPLMLLHDQRRWLLVRGHAVDSPDWAALEGVQRKPDPAPRPPRRPARRVPA